MEGRYIGQTGSEGLERVRGTKWRPEVQQKVTFCWYKVILDEVYRLIQTDLILDDDVTQLDDLRGNDSLIKLWRTLQGRKAIGGA